jgi:hypothetical protein
MTIVTSGETMAIKRVDDHHLSTVLKMNGKLFGTSEGHALGERQDANGHQ